MLNLTAPVRVAVMDAAGPLADIDCGRAEQPSYIAAWILVCKAGRPIGSIEIPLREPVIGVAELEREVNRQLGEDWHRDGPVAHQPPPPLPLSRASVVVPTNFARLAELRRCLKALAELDHTDDLVQAGRQSGEDVIKIPRLVERRDDDGDPRRRGPRRWLCLFRRVTGGLLGNVLVPTHLTALGVTVGVQ